MKARSDMLKAPSITLNACPNSAPNAIMLTANIQNHFSFSFFHNRLKASIPERYHNAFGNE